MDSISIVHQQQTSFMGASALVSLIEGAHVEHGARGINRTAKFCQLYTAFSTF